MSHPRKIITVDADVAQWLGEVAARRGRSTRDVASAIITDFVAKNNAHPSQLRDAITAALERMPPTPRGRPKGTMGKLRRMSE